MRKKFHAQHISIWESVVGKEAGAFLPLSAMSLSLHYRASKSLHLCIWSIILLCWGESCGTSPCPEPYHPGAVHVSLENMSLPRTPSEVSLCFCYFEIVCPIFWDSVFWCIDGGHLGVHPIKVSGHIMFDRASVNTLLSKLWALNCGHRANWNTCTLSCLTTILTWANKSKRRGCASCVKFYFMSLN